MADRERAGAGGRDVLLLSDRERELDLRETVDRRGPRGTLGRVLEEVQLFRDRGGDGDPGSREGAGGFDGALPTTLDRVRDGPSEVLGKRLRLLLDAVPIRTSGKLPQLGESFGGLRRGDPQRVQERDLLFRLLLARLRRLALFFQRLGLFL
ncbi:MAG: hypothetical protein ACRECT_04060 [Thermoplasmata archaeon]